jgi:hypothetical protein
MAGCKHTLKGKHESSRKCTAIDLEVKIGMICKYGGGQHISAIGFAVSTLNTIMEAAAHIKEYVNFVFLLIHIYLLIQYIIHIFFSIALYY